MSETRTITVKGDASIFKVGVDSPPGAKTTRRRARAITTAVPTVFVKMDAGGGPATSASAVAEMRTSAKHADPSVATSAPASAPAADAGRQAAANTVTPAKVVLGGKKPKAMKVLLTKKNHGPAETPASAAQPKKHRKVTLGIQHLKRRVTKARRLNKMTKTLSLDQIRKELVDGKIIKEESKAPEAILRQMYADAKLITTKSL